LFKKSILLVREGNIAQFCRLDYLA
jgi:hypothetical protein